MSPLLLLSSFNFLLDTGFHFLPFRPLLRSEGVAVCPIGFFALAGALNMALGEDERGDGHDGTVNKKECDVGGDEGEGEDADEVEVRHFGFC